MKIKEYKTYTWQEILDMKVSKSELAITMGIECSYDTAVPQEWLNKFVEFYEFDYHQVIFSSFMVYDEGDYFGQVHSAVTEIQHALNKEKIEWIADQLADNSAQFIADELKRLTGVDIGRGQADLSRNIISTLNLMKLKEK